MLNKNPDEMEPLPRGLAKLVAHSVGCRGLEFGPWFRLKRAVTNLHIGFQSTLPLRLEETFAVLIMGRMNERAQRALEEQCRAHAERLQAQYRDCRVAAG
jgi:hypothetical protein